MWNSRNVGPQRHVETTGAVLAACEALSQTVKFERNCHLAEPPSDASSGGVVRAHRAVEAYPITSRLDPPERTSEASPIERFVNAVNKMKKAPSETPTPWDAFL